MSKAVFIFSQYIIPPEYPGGRNRYLLARELARKGIDVYVFSSSFNHMIKKYVRHFDDLYMIEDVEGIKFVWVNTFKYSKNNWRRYINMAGFGLKCYRAAGKLVQKGIRPDVVIGSVSHAFSVAAAYYASRKFKTKFFIEIGDLWPEVFIESGTMTHRNLLYISVKKVMYYFFEKADNIICITNATKGYLEKLGHGDKTIVLPFGVEIDGSISAQTMSNESGDFNIIYSGSFQPIYPLDNLIKAAKIIEDSGNKNIKFTLIGNGLQKPDLIRMTERLNIRNVEFIDHMPKKDLLKSLQSASAFILLEKHGRYGFPNKIIDYLSVGRPIIYISPARHEVLEGGCCLEAQNDPDDIVRAVEEVSSMPVDKQKEMGSNANKFLIDNHNIEEITQRLIDYL